MKPSVVVSNSAFIENGLLEIFGQDLALSDLPDMRQSVDQVFGQAEARGMLLRAGRAAFYYWMRENADALGWREVDFRLLPAPGRIKKALNDALLWFETESLLKGELSITESVWQITVTGLVGKSVSLDCSIFIGLMQELTCWAGAGKVYPAREVECQSDGMECCLFEISKQPVG